MKKIGLIIGIKGKEKRKARILPQKVNLDEAMGTRIGRNLEKGEKPSLGPLRLSTKSVRGSPMIFQGAPPLPLLVIASRTDRVHILATSPVPNEKSKSTSRINNGVLDGMTKQRITAFSLDLVGKSLDPATTNEIMTIIGMVEVVGMEGEMLLLDVIEIHIGIEIEITIIEHHTSQVRAIVETAMLRAPDLKSRSISVALASILRHLEMRRHDLTTIHRTSPVVPAPAGMEGHHPTHQPGLTVEVAQPLILLKDVNGSRIIEAEVRTGPIVIVYFGVCKAEVEGERITVPVVAPNLAQSSRVGTQGSSLVQL